MGVLLLMSGIHIGLIVATNTLKLNEVIQTIIPILYWGMVAVGLTTIHTADKLDYLDVMILPDENVMVNVENLGLAPNE